MKVLVTGCGGFLGSNIVQQLLRRGDQVKGLGRSDYPELQRAGVDLVQGDVRNAAIVQQACQGVDAVIHTAAKAGIWGPWKTYHEINTVGTENVIAGCRKAGVNVLVYTSSPSVTFDGEDQTDVDESVPYPQHWLCAYPQTKALGEQAVLAAHQLGNLHTAALRPHLIWGLGDPHLFPRLVARAKSGRLRIVGDGNNMIDTVHVTNAAAAHLNALDQLTQWSDPVAGGKAFFITQGKPVNCWEWIAKVLEVHGVTPPTKRIGFESAWKVGAAFEKFYKLFRIKSEPPMTRFVAAQLAKDHSFDISAARKLLRYQPTVSDEQGLLEIAKSLA